MNPSFAPASGALPVLLGGENGAVPIVRSLVRGGMREFIVGSERSDDPTFRSRYCAGKIALEPFGEPTDDRNVETLVEFARSRQEKPVLYWGSDREILFINRNRHLLLPWFRFVMPDAALTETLVDKGKFAAFAASRNLPVPETLVLTSTKEILRHRQDIPYPCTVKPVHMSNWYSDFMRWQFGSYKHALRCVRDADELTRYVSFLPAVEKGVVVQRFIEGRDEELFSFHGYFNTRGIPVAGFVGRKIRTNPIHFGGSTYIETVRRPDVMGFCIEACRDIGFTGIVKIDCKRDAVTGKFYILEFNLRFTLWHHLGASAGLNIPRLWYDDLAGDGAKPSFSYESGRRWVHVTADVRALPAYLRAGEWTVAQWLRSYRASKVYHTFDWRDPMPFLIALPRFLKRRIARWLLVRRQRQRWPRTALIALDSVRHPSGMRA